MVQRAFPRRLGSTAVRRAPTYRMGDIEMGGVVDRPERLEDRFCSTSFPVTERRNGAPLE